MADDSPLEPPVTGLVAGKYELTRLIGRGGMGSVWEGKHVTLGTRVAVKFIEAEYANSNEARSRFDNEAHAAAKLQSKHAIQIYDHGVTDNGRPYIVMELLLGEPLDRRIERLGKITLHETARILQHVCRALHKAHEQGIIHRDLKPENVFLVRGPDDDDEIAKVLDFGIAKIKGPPSHAQGVSSSTKTGAVLGTPYYMSPEQARGLRNIDHRTDLWSLGVIAFKCVTGHLPFEGESVGDLLVKICTAPAPTPSHVQPGLPPSFDHWFFRALEREPARRFNSAQELAEALAFAAGLSVRVRPPSSSTPEPTAFAATGHAPSMPHTTPNPHHPPHFTPQGQHYPQHAPHSFTPPTHPSPQHVASQPNMTSAPFITSTGAVPKKSSAGVILASVGAAVIGLGIGVFAIVKFTGSSNTATGAGVQPATTTTTTTVQTTTETTAKPTEKVQELPPLQPPPEKPVATTPTTLGKPQPGAAKPPTPGTKPSTTAAITPSVPSGKPSAPPPPPPPPPRNTGDPGY
jgi:serine/threonine-protein kinase